MTWLQSALSGAWRFLRRNYAMLYSAALLLMIVLGVIGGPNSRLIDIELWKLGVIFCGALLLIFKLLRYFRRETRSTFDTLEIGILSVAVVNSIIQSSGGVSGQLYPINYMLVVLIVAFSTIPIGLLFSAILAATELGQKLYLGIEPIEMLQVLYHFCFMLLFCLGLGIFLKLERDQVKRAQAVLAKLRHDAVDLASRAGTHDELASLSRDAKDRSTVRKVFSLDEELYTVLTIAQRVFGAYSAVLLLLDPDSRYLRVRMQISGSKHVCDVESIKLSQTALNWVIKHGTHLALPTIRDSDQLGYYKRRERVRSVLAAPVLRLESPTGVLVVDSLEESSFDRRDGRVLGSFAQLISQSIEQSRLNAELEAEKSEFAAFFKVSQGLTSSLELSNLGRIVLESAQSILDYGSGLMVLLESDGKQAWIESTRGRFADELADKKFDLREGLVGWSITNRRFLAYADIREWERSLKKSRRRPLLSNNLKLRDVGSLLCIPLLHLDRGIGAIVLAWRKPRSFSDFEQKIMRVFADQCTQALVNARMYLRMEQMATTDGLTNLANHRIFQEFLVRELARAERMPTQISLVMVDIDHFKLVNDTYGHPAGDEVLRRLAALLGSSVRRIDLAARYGGEEFAIVLLNTNAEGTIKFSDRLRKAVANMRIPFEQKTLKITISVGIACYPDDALTKPDLIEMADNALYFSKNNGRNRVTHIRDLSAKDD
ncbi:MAG: diguanylate cyclase [Candidatus Alcyoniella australis]|nr:diguanylate cyclase [Candidatus Alcyoniella australis]